MFLPNLMSQKSSPKASDNFNKDRRFKLWKDNNVNSLLSECMAIQQRLSNSNINRDEKHISKTFAYFTKSGNINTVLRLLSENPDSSVLSYNALQKIKLKDSEASLNYNVLMLSAPLNEAHDIIFDDINEELIQKAAIRIRGTEDPLEIDADDGRRILGSNTLGKQLSNFPNL